MCDVLIAGYKVPCSMPESQYQFTLTHITCYQFNLVVKLQTIYGNVYMMA